MSDESDLSKQVIANANGEVVSISVTPSMAARLIEAFAELRLAERARPPTSSKEFVPTFP
jgi:hypothetical protein